MRMVSLNLVHEKILHCRIGKKIYCDQVLELLRAGYLHEILGYSVSQLYQSQRGRVSPDDQHVPRSALTLSR